LLGRKAPFTHSKIKDKKATDSSHLSWYLSLWWYLSFCWRMPFYLL